MKKVITYGTYDLLHYGHIKLLERAKALGDYLIVGVTSDDFDKQRGKINVQQSLMERINGIKQTGLADKIIIEEYEGQKIDDIINYDVDIFAIGSDWEGKFDYLKDYCEVMYLERTPGISSTEIRTKNRNIIMGAVGNERFVKKYIEESRFVNGLDIPVVYIEQNKEKIADIHLVNTYDELLEIVDAVYIGNHPSKHYEFIKKALESGKHVLFESPMTLTVKETNELINLANSKKLVLMEGIKTAYSTAYSRLLLLAKSGKIGDIVSIDVTCTSLREIESLGIEKILNKPNSICAWGPTSLLPVYQLLGINYNKKMINTLYANKNSSFDLFTNINLVYNNAIANIKVGQGVKSEGELIISGTKGYLYVPSPWWKTDYFELRYEKMENNKRYFYQLNGEGIRYELVYFLKSIENGQQNVYIDSNISKSIVSLIEDYYNKVDVNEISIV